MSLYEQWLKQAYDSRGQNNPKVWKAYLPVEQKIYENILGDKSETFETSPKELSEKYGWPVIYSFGFFDGIKESLNNEIDPEELEEDTRLTLNINFPKLYEKMIEYKATHLQKLSEWDGILSKEERDAIKYNMTQGKIYVRDESKTGRNDPCPCGSGKKYKKCCGA